MRRKKEAVQIVEPQITGSATENGLPAYKVMQKPPKQSFADPKGIMRNIKDLTRLLEGMHPVDPTEVQDRWAVLCRLFDSWTNDPAYRVKVPIVPPRVHPGPWAGVVSVHKTVWLISQEPPLKATKDTWLLTGNHYRRETEAMLRDLVAHPMFSEGLSDSVIFDACEIAGLPHSLRETSTDRQWWGCIAYTRSGAAHFLCVESGASGIVPFSGSSTAAKYLCKIGRGGLAMTASLQSVQYPMLYLNRLSGDADTVTSEIKRIVRYRLGGGHVLTLTPDGRAKEEAVAGITDEELEREAEQARKAMAGQFPFFPVRSLREMAGR